KHTVPAAAVNRKIIVFPVYGVIYYLAINKSIYLATAKCIMDSAERRSCKSAFTINLLHKHFVLKYQLVVNLLELKVRGAFINITGSPLIEGSRLGGQPGLLDWLSGENENFLNNLQQ